ncbi:MAG: response regulator [Caulobacteraceae bacterium]|nr:response regulator [Caulobacteraceae bacterium]
MQVGAEMQVRALVADDHPTNRLVLQTLLSQFGCAVSLAADGLEASDIASLQPFDLIIMDRNMPRRNGDEAARSIRETGGPSAGSLIVLWTTDPPSAALPPVYDRNLAKPVAVDDLTALLELALERLRAAKVTSSRRNVN